MIVTLVQTSVSSNRTGTLWFDPLTIAVVGRGKKSANLSKYFNSSEHFRLKNLAESYLLRSVCLHIRSVLRCIVPSSVYCKTAALSGWRGRKIKRSVLIPFHTDTDHRFAIPTLYAFNRNTVEKRMVKALGMSFFGVIGFSNFLSTSHSAVLTFWGGSKKFSTTQ